MRTLSFSFTPRFAALTVALLATAITTAQAEYYPIHFVSDAELCVAAPNTNTGSQLRLEFCDDNDDRQLWEHDNNGLFRLKSNTSRCARRTGDTSSSIVLATCNSGASDQQWDVNEDGNLSITASSNSNYCWESRSGSSSGSLLEIENCATSNIDQRFDYGSYFSNVEVLNNSGRCLSAPSTSTGNILELQTCNGDNLRKWRLDPDNYLLRLRADPRRCASLTSTTSGRVVDLVECDDGDSFQRWEYTSSNEMRSRNRELCMQFNSENTGQEILAYNCDGGSDQEWRFLDDPGPGTDYMRYHVEGNSNLCLGADSSAVNTELELYECDDDDLRLWKLNSDNQLVLKANSNRCAQRMGSGATVELQSCSTNNNQRWEFNGNGDSEIKLTSSSQCMQYGSESIGENVITQTCDRGSDQRWDREDPGGTTDYMYYQVLGNSNRCIGVDSTSVNTEVELYECDGDDRRIWRMNSNRQLVLKANSNRCAQRFGSGSVVQIRACDTSINNQRWEFNNNNDNEIANPNSSQCMQYNSESLGTSIITQTCDGGGDQEFDQVNPDDDDDEYKPIKLRSNTSRCLGVDSTSTGTQVEVVGCSTSDSNRLWYLDSNRRLRLKANTNRCMTRDSSTSSSTNYIRIESCTSGSDDDQEWRYNDNLDYEFESQTSGSSTLCMQYSSTNAGTSIVARTCDGGSDQEFDYDDTENPSTDGKVIFPNNGDDCLKCIGVNTVSDGSFLRWIDCDTSDDNLVRWVDYPDTTSGGSFWCIVEDISNDDLCVVPDANAPTTGTRLKLVSENSVTNSQSLLWFYNDAGNSVTDDITHWSSESLCVGVADNGVDVVMLACTDTDPRQSWRIVDYDDKEDVCDELDDPDAPGRDPSATSPGSLIYVNTEDDCYDCITITGCTQNNYNCATARLAIANCFTADDFSYLKYWTEVPSPSGTQWCSRDSNFCIQYSTSAPSNLELITTSGGQNRLWYTAAVGSGGSLEIQPEISADLCIASDGSAPLVEECTKNTDNPKQWAITSFNEWTQTCDPLGRDPGSIPGMFIHVDTDSDCGWCIGVDTTANPPAIAMAPCIDSNDNYETSFKENMVPSESNRWCLESDSSICIKYDTAVSGDLTVVTYTGNQNELWYFESQEITPLLRADRCVVWDSSRNLYMDTCSNVPLENREWKIINANAYSCDTLGVSSFSGAGGLGRGMGGAVMSVMVLSALAFAVVA